MENKDSGKLGLVACIAILTGGCIGSAIFSLSGMTMYYAGPAAIITWIVAAIILGCYGVQVAELSVQIAEKILRAKLSGDKEQNELIDRLLDEVSSTDNNVK